MEPITEEQLAELFEKLKKLIAVLPSGTSGFVPYEKGKQNGK